MSRTDSFELYFEMIATYLTPLIASAADFSLHGQRAQAFE